MDQYIGKFLDNRYELLEVIGTGGMAVVYKARCHRLNRLVAVKVLKSDLAQDAEFRRRFHDESQAVAMLSHPNIVAVYDVSRSSDLDYIVMELIDGITLKQYMQKKGPLLNWREALHFITQIMRALSHAHSRGIIHRDIKPHNIMVLRDGSVKVADFGIARLVSAAQSTLTQEALGSVHYISPEQARGSHIDARADIYSAGVVLYEMTTGRLPFEGDSAVSVAIQHISSIPLSPRELNQDIPEALEAIILKAMAPMVDQRYTGADAMLADLEEFRKNPNINFDYNLAELAAAADTDEPTQIRQHSQAARRMRDTGRAAQAVKTERRREEDNEADFPAERESVLPLLLAIGAILVFIVGIGYFLWVAIFNDLIKAPTSYVVPDVRGLTIEQAEALPEVKDTFTIVRGAVLQSDTVPAGQIIDQLPEPRLSVREGSLVITVDVSAGLEELRMPLVANMEQRLAEEQLAELGLAVTVYEAHSETITRGYVISATPANGSLIVPGDEATITVSLGPTVKMAMVPSFAGLTLEYVKTQITLLGLKTGMVEELPSDQYAAGMVIGQSIIGEVVSGAVIDLQVSTGKAPDNPPANETEPPDSEPDPSPSPSQAEATPSPSPSPTQSELPVTSKSFEVTMPDRDGTVLVLITVGGVERWRNPVDCRTNPVINPRVSGSGVQEVCVYLDGELVNRFDLDFNER